MTSPPPRIPLNFFGIPFGVLGLADCWIVGAKFDLVSVGVGRVLVGASVVGWLVVLGAYLRGLLAHRVGIGAQLADPVAGPFASLAVITPMLAAADILDPYSHDTATVVVDVLTATVVVLAGWLTGKWIYGPLNLAQVHPGYFLPSVAGGFVAAASTGLVGQHDLAEVLFGIALVSWLVIGSIMLGRLFLGPPLPTPLYPTIAIEVAPAAVATFAAFVIDGFRVDTTVRFLAGYGVLMVIAQLPLLPAYRRLTFAASFWAFTFSWASVCFAGMTWLGVTRPPGWRAESYAALGLISLFIGAFAVKTAVALRRGQLLPKPTPAPSESPSPSATPSLLAIGGSRP